jgi:CheY-like chemotaxis protein
MRKPRRTADAKLRVLYCDDDPRFIEAFRDRHNANFCVEHLTDIGSVYRDITRRSDAELPDVLLLDLYHPVALRDTAEGLAIRERAKERLDALSAMIREVREDVDRAWSPSAIDVLEELRQDYPEYKLPVMIYTQRGLLLLDDDELRRIGKANAEWLLKDGNRVSGATEETWIRRYVRQANAERRIPRDLWLAGGSVVLSAALGVFATLLLS